MEYAEGGLGWRVWPAAVLLGQFICNHSEIVISKTVLELGAGLGLPGLLAGKLGASRVCLTDCLPLALAKLNKSIQANNLTDIAEVANLDWVVQSGADETACGVRDHKSGALTTEAFLQRQHGEPTILIPPEDQFDVVIASDVLYEKHHAECIVAVLAARCKRGGCCVLACVIRDGGISAQVLAKRALATGFKGTAVIPGTLGVPAEEILLRHIDGAAVNRMAKKGIVLFRFRSDIKEGLEEVLPEFEQLKVEHQDCTEISGESIKQEVEEQNQGEENDEEKAEGEEFSLTNICREYAAAFVSNNFVKIGNLLAQEVAFSSPVADCAGSEKVLAALRMTRGRMAEEVDVGAPKASGPSSSKVELQFVSANGKGIKLVDNVVVQRRVITQISRVKA
jgi:predicted nicotinamide N-methyase